MLTLVLVILAFFLPPLAVFMMSGLNRDFWINLILTLLGWIPGTIHAIYLILTRPAIK